MHRSAAAKGAKLVSGGFTRSRSASFTSESGAERGPAGRSRDRGSGGDWALRRTLAATCLVQFAQGSIMVSGVVTDPGLGAALLQLSSYVAAVLVLRLHQFRNVREEMLVGGLLLGLVGHIVASRVAASSYALLVLCYSVLGGLGSGILASSISRANFHALQQHQKQQLLSVFERAWFQATPVFFYGLGGFCFAFMHSIRKMSDPGVFEPVQNLLDHATCMSIVGWLVLGLVFICAFVLIPDGQLKSGIPAPPPMLRPGRLDVAFFALTGLFSAFVAVTAALPMHGMVLNGTGRVVAGLVAEVFGFPLAQTASTLLASAVMATTYAPAVTASTPDVSLVLALGACIGLLGRNQWASAACIIYGSVYFVGVVALVPRLVAFFGVQALGQSLGLALLTVGVGSFGGRAKQ